MGGRSIAWLTQLPADPAPDGCVLTRSIAAMDAGPPVTVMSGSGGRLPRSQDARAPVRAGDGLLSATRAAGVKFWNGTSIEATDAVAPATQDHPAILTGWWEPPASPYNAEGKLAPASTGTLPLDASAVPLTAYLSVTSSGR